MQHFRKPSIDGCLSSSVRPSSGVPVADQLDKRVSMNSTRFHRIKKGLDLPLRGSVGQVVYEGPPISEVAVIPDDWVDVSARLAVEVGARVRIGDLLFEDRRNPGVRFTSPGSGTVSAVNLGERRQVSSIVISIDGSREYAGFPSYSGRALADLSGDEVRALMVESGLWTALRQRPFSTVPPVDAPAAPIFVTAIDTYPLAPDPVIAISERRGEFLDGLAGLVRLAGGRPVFVCVGDGPGVEGIVDVPGVEVHTFTGPHPAGLPGTHIHFISPASVGAPRWHIGYQDVIALGALLASGRLMVDRVVGVAGPAVTDPVIWRTRLGAAIGPLLVGRLARGENRVISGSPVFGRGVFDIPQSYLGRFHNQVTAIPEDRDRVFLGWLGAGLHRFSVLPIFLSRFLPGADYEINTSTNGSVRAVMPFGMMERVMPLDIMPVQLCRALMMKDVEWATELGALELDPEDLALCTLVCPGKNDYGQALTEVLAMIRKEG